MIILQSQISEINLDTLTLSLSAKFIETPFISLDILTLSMSLPVSPSLQLIQLDTLTLALSPTVIPANVPIVVGLSPATMTFVVKSIGTIRETGHVLQDLLLVLKEGGAAPVTPPRFTDCDFMDIIDAFRAGTTQPEIPEDETCMMSDLLNALDIGNPIPFEVPIIGTWFGEQEWPPYIPSVRDAIVRISGSSPFDIYISYDKGLTWTAHPKATVDTETPPSGIVYKLSYIGNGIILFVSWSDAGIVNRGSNYGLTWTRMNMSAYTTKQIDFIYPYNSLTFVTDVYDGVNPVKLLRSTNYGLSYTAYTITGALAISSISAIDSDTLLMCKRLTTGYGGIAKSVDGGITWTDKYTSVLYSSALIKYLENGIVLCAEVGRYVYESQTMLRSTDYGETWVQVPNNIRISGYIKFIEYLGNGIVLMVGNYGAVYRSTDYGLTWTGVYSGGESITNIINFGYGEILVTVYGYYSTIWQVRSTDYGITWTVGDRLPMGLYTYIPK